MNPPRTFPCGFTAVLTYSFAANNISVSNLFYPMLTDTLFYLICLQNQFDVRGPLCDLFNHTDFSSSKSLSCTVTRL